MTAKEKEETRNRQIMIRLTGAEKEWLEAYADKQKRSVSDAVRLLAFEALRREDHESCQEVTVRHFGDIYQVKVVADDEDGVVLDFATPGEHGGSEYAFSDTTRIPEKGRNSKGGITDVGLIRAAIGCLTQHAE